MNRELLEQPFGQDQIRQRTGNLGETLDYVEAHVVIQRLNDAFEGQWSFEIPYHEVFKEEVVVKGLLTANEITKSQFGSSKVTRNPDTGEVLSVADDLKAAATDALKKAATLFGVGLHLYIKQGHNSSKPLNGNPQPVTDHDSKLTNKQLNYIVTVGADLDMDTNELDRISIGQFGVGLPYLSKRNASALIDQLLLDLNSQPHTRSLFEQPQVSNSSPVFDHRNGTLQREELCNHP